MGGLDVVERLLTVLAVEELWLAQHTGVGRQLVAAAVGLGGDEPQRGRLVPWLVANGLAVGPEVASVALVMLHGRMGNGRRLIAPAHGMVVGPVTIDPDRSEEDSIDARA